METRINLLPSTIETIDFALFDFINEKMNVSCNTHNGWEKIPVIWAGNERSVQIKRPDGSVDKAGSLIFPILSIERTEINKNVRSKGKYYANIPPVNDYKQGSIVRAKIVKQDKTSEFANADIKKSTVGKINFPCHKENEKIVYEIYNMSQPVYVEMVYKLRIKTEYQQQMNEAVQPFLVRPGTVHRAMLERDGYKYEAFFEENFVIDNNLDNMSEEIRKFETEIEVRVYGILISAGENETSPYKVIRENPVEIKFPRERVIFGDIPGFPGYGKYRP